MTELSQLSEETKELFKWTIEPRLFAITSALEAVASESVRFVGGCVRDSLRGSPPDFTDPDNQTDIDIATTLWPEETIQALQNAGIKAIPTGIDHGTITAVSGGLVAEITTLRADVDTNGRHAEVAFGKSWDDDAKRRDFTINAMYLTPQGELFDPMCGRDDLLQNRVKFIGNPVKRIREDYLRILRFFRFSAGFAKVIDEEGLKAIEREVSGLEQISVERIQSELLRMFAGPSLGTIMPAMQETDVLRYIFPDQADISAVLDIFNLAQRENINVLPEDYLVALWPRAANIGRQLRLSNNQSIYCKKLNALTKNTINLSEIALKELLYKQGSELYRGCLMSAWSRDCTQNETYKRAFALPKHWHVPANPFNGKLFKSLGVPQGVKMGEALKKAETLWIKRGFTLDENEIAAIQQQVLAEFG